MITGEVSADTTKAKAVMRDVLKLSDEEIQDILDGTTTHHVEGGTQLEFVPSDLHSAYRHTGGAADIKAGNAYIKPGISANNPYAETAGEEAAIGETETIVSKEGVAGFVVAAALFIGDEARAGVEYHEEHKEDIPSYISHGLTNNSSTDPTIHTDPNDPKTGSFAHMTPPPAGF